MTAEWRPPILPSIQGDIHVVVRRLREWANASGLPQHDEPGVEYVPPVRAPRPEWTRWYVDPSALPGDGI